MSEKTHISWTDRTWNPWRGCTKIDPGCKNCYMFTEQIRYGKDPATVVRTKTWRDPIRWQHEAATAGTRLRVFTCSWSDWFHADADAWRNEAWSVVRACPNLTFQILTKRAGRIESNLPSDWGNGYPNVWLGVSVSEPKGVWRADALRTIPARVRFVSYEPALASVAESLDLTGIHWLIAGGESGPGFRPMETQWARDMRTRCRMAGAKFFFKQSSAPRTEMGIGLDGQIIREFPGEC